VEINFFFSVTLSPIIHSIGCNVYLLEKVLMAHCQITDENLILATLNGDKTCFASLVDKYWPVTIAVATARVCNIDDAEDIAQNSFIKAYHNLGTLKDKSRFSRWLYKIVIQESVNHLRKRKKSKLVSIGEHALNIPDPVTSNPGLTTPQKQFVRQAVASLAEKYSIVIIMRFIGGFNASQIAEQIGEKPNAVRTRLHRAYKMLKKSLTPLAMEVEIS
jgi:RNA polymerase sigma-70 factor (ECF subfamily)